MTLINNEYIFNVLFEIVITALINYAINKAREENYFT